MPQGSSHTTHRGIALSCIRLRWPGPAAHYARGAESVFAKALSLFLSLSLCVCVCVCVCVCGMG